jgi:hypothetical protein
MGMLFGLLLIVGAVIHYFWWIATTAVVVGALRYGRVMCLAGHMAADAESRHQADVRARADQQHA